LLWTLDIAEHFAYRDDVLFVCGRLAELLFLALM